MIERGGTDAAGGNSYFTAGATRIAHDGLDDLLAIVEPDPRHARTVVPPYSRQEYAADLARVTGGRNDPALTAVLVDEADGAVRWLHGLGMRYRLMYERQAYEGADGRHLFFGGLHVGNVDGGVGLMADHTRIAERLGIEVRYGTRATDLVTDDGRVVGVRAVGSAGPVEVGARSVVLAAGGFEADADLRRRHLGAGLGARRVRGTPLNTGDMIAAATRIGAATSGDWSGGPQRPVGCPPRGRGRRPPAHQPPDPAELPARDPGQRRWRALRRRGRRLPQLHLRPLRTRRSSSSRAASPTSSSTPPPGHCCAPRSTRCQASPWRPPTRSTSSHGGSGSCRSAWPRPSPPSTPASTSASRSTRPSRTVGGPHVRAAQEQLGAGRSRRRRSTPSR